VNWFFVLHLGVLVVLECGYESLLHSSGRDDLGVTVQLINVILSKLCCPKSKISLSELNKPIRRHLTEDE
jgi:hypothetical protein